MASLELDSHLLAALQTLADHRVEHVVVGDVGDAVHEGGGVVDALAIVPSGYARNVDRLAEALDGLGAQLRIAGGRTAPLDPDPARLRQMGRCTLATRRGDLELDFEPPGTAGYPDLYADARPTPLGERLAPLVASPEDLDRIDASRASGPRVSARRASPSADPAGARERVPARSR
ncbi:MAG: hypothetical protein M3296_00420 [Actinomycetota bacterium]|nr:hypothetical protein [Actinomycetota bacterium]